MFFVSWLALPLAVAKVQTCKARENNAVTGSVGPRRARPCKGGKISKFKLSNLQEEGCNLSCADDRVLSSKQCGTFQFITRSPHLAVRQKRWWSCSSSHPNIKGGIFGALPLLTFLFPVDLFLPLLTFLLSAQCLRFGLVLRMEIQDQDASFSKRGWMPWRQNAIFDWSYVVAWNLPMWGILFSLHFNCQRNMTAYFFKKKQINSSSMMFGNVHLECAHKIRTEIGTMWLLWRANQQKLWRSFEGPR